LEPPAHRRTDHGTRPAGCSHRHGVRCDHDGPRLASQSFQAAGVRPAHRKICEHIDHICQLAGNARHVGIGTDLDGGYGTEQTPLDLDSIADLTKLDDLLAKRGYSAADITGISRGNFFCFLRENLK
jgi:microsomal dipeptidase-like Zn-dependent dipeptidase